MVLRALEPSGSGEPSSYCTLMDMYCDPLVYQVGEEEVVAGDSWEGLLESCSQACTDKQGCNFFTLLKIRNGSSCSLLSECSGIYYDVCLERSSCSSGPKPEDCLAGSVTLAPPSCTPPTQHQPPFLQWQCTDSQGDILSPADTFLPGTSCTLKCKRWTTQDLRPAYLVSECQDDGEWSETKVNNGDKNLLHPNEGPYPKPDTPANSLLPEPLECLCLPLPIVWPPHPDKLDQAVQEAWMSSLPSGINGDYTKLAYDPNQEEAAEFVCEKNITGSRVAGVLTLYSDAKCTLFCDKHLEAEVKCSNGEWTGNPEKGFYCFKLPEIHGGWSAWGTWTFNSTAGLKVRQRNCDNPPASEGGRDCPGPNVAQESSRVCERVIVRKKITSLTGAEKTKLNSQLKEMKQRGTGLTGFETLGSLHGLPYMCNLDQTALGSENGCCINHWMQADRIDDFVTWHRLYMYNFEMALLEGDAATTLGVPYWDWTESPTNKTELPATTSEWTNGPIQTVPGNDSYCEGTPGEGTTCRNIQSCTGATIEEKPNCFVTSFQKAVKTALQQTIWVNFNAQIVMPHDNIHDFVGGDMGGTNYAAYDPLFFLHHSYVDYLFAYYEELQKLRNQGLEKPDFCANTQAFEMYPFAASENPFNLSRLQSTGPETFITEDSFCYVFDNLEFMGLSPEQFIQQENAERQQAKLFIGMIIPRNGLSASIKFSIQGSGFSISGIGSVGTFGNSLDTPNLGMITSNSLRYIEVDLSALPLQYSLVEGPDRSITFSVEDYSTRTTSLDAASQPKPLVVYKKAGAGYFNYRLHTAHADEYHEELHLLPGSRLELVAPDGAPASLVDYTQDSPTPHSEGTFDIKYEDHLLEIGGSRNITIGHQRLYKCIGGSPACNPSGKEDGVIVIPWDTQASTLGSVKVFTRAASHNPMYVLLAWCEGLANVHKFDTKEQFDRCEGVNDGGARQGPNSYFIDNSKPTVYYLANGVGDACQNGWKIEIFVLL